MAIKASPQPLPHAVPIVTVPRREVKRKNGEKRAKTGNYPKRGFAPSGEVVGPSNASIEPRPTSAMSFSSILAASSIRLNITASSISAQSRSNRAHLSRASCSLEQGIEWIGLSANCT